jgi:DNA-binding MarR family transcriptional regulator
MTDAILRRKVVLNDTDALRKFLEAHQELVKRLILSATQYRLLQLVRKMKCVESPDIAKVLGISLQNASRQLTVLWEKGYLEREDVGSPSGGSLYQYWSRSLQ